MLALVLAGCGTAPATAPRFEPPAFARTDGWWPCPLTGMEQRECRRVPVSVGGPHAERTTLAVTRLPARDPDRRIGALVLAPGGPGLSGLQEAVAAGTDYPRELRDRFDIVGVDRRGVGRSGAVDCGEPIGPLDALRTARHIGRVPDLAAVDAQARDYVEYCRIQHGQLIGHLGTRFAVRDLEAVREALGEERISLLMHSYGTVLGQLYLAEHPDRVRSAVFDGVVDPDRTGPAMALRTLHSAQELDDEHVAPPQSRRVPADVMAAFRELDPGRPPLALFLGVQCADFAWPDTVAELLSELAEAQDRGGEPRWRVNTVARDYAACVHWPVREPALGALGRPAGPGPDPLLVNAERDIRTPLPGAERVAERFGAPLLTVPGGRHGLVGHGDACAEQAAVGHLTGERVAEAGARVRC